LKKSKLKQNIPRINLILLQKLKH